MRRRYVVCGTRLLTGEKSTLKMLFSSQMLVLRLLKLLSRLEPQRTASSEMYYRCSYVAFKFADRFGAGLCSNSHTCG